MMCSSLCRQVNVKKCLLSLLYEPFLLHLTQITTVVTQGESKETPLVSQLPLIETPFIQRRQQLRHLLRHLSL